MTTWIQVGALLLVALTMTPATAEFVATTRAPLLSAPESVECDGSYPDTLLGTWRTDPERTRKEYLQRHPDVDPESLPQLGETLMTFHQALYVTEVPNIGRFERPYRVVGGNSRNYTLELYDDEGDSMSMQVILVPCGLAIETPERCTSTFCAKARDEVLQKIVDMSNGGVTLEQLRRSVDEADVNRVARPDRRLTYYRRAMEDGDSDS